MTANETPGARAARDSGIPHLTLKTPDAILAAIPHMLGFYPSQSLVVLGLSGRPGTLRLTFRYDLPDPPDSVLALDIAEHAVAVLRQQRLRLAVLVGYGPPVLVTPVLAMVAETFELNRIELREALRADGGRYWSVLCDDPACCPAEGRPFDPGSHPAAAVMAEAGLEALPDRAALSRTLLPPAGSTERIRESTRLAEQLLVDLGTRYWAAGGDDLQQVTAKAGRTAVQRAIRRYRDGGAIADVDRLAWLAVLLADLRVRDDAWARMDPHHNEAHRRLWTDVTRLAQPGYVAAPAALLAFTAWQSGSGALANIALDRALADQPDYSMAKLLRQALDSGAPPSMARLPMTPEEVAASYNAMNNDEEDDDGAGNRGGEGSPRPDEDVAGLVS
jgi:Domain of unknown function (DUF4192)